MNRINKFMMYLGWFFALNITGQSLYAITKFLIRFYG